ncbi:hypothetical protein JRG50_11210 [Micrococcus luteus]|uniref:hypothetical protein n=1 Tax=Micrococcus luteus TaxID=1270 RepID=UPI0016511609|nr:hypothetical protein [Micrococcus luteus]MBN6761001.1 hypothetical protein [Micrococcus luteus]MBN6802489.1 hypothetical protein [Micrococcus luteus]
MHPLLPIGCSGAAAIGASDFDSLRSLNRRYTAVAQSAGRGSALRPRRDHRPHLVEHLGARDDRIGRGAQGGGVERRALLQKS